MDEARDTVAPVSDLPRPAGHPAGQTDGRLCALLSRSGQGDQDAFAELYDAVAPRVYGLAVRVVRDAAVAEEVAESALLEVWRTASSHDPAAADPLSWLLGIAHRHAAERARVDGIRPAPGADLTAVAAGRGRELRVRRALASLPRVQREAVVLAHGGCTHTEVARRLDIPVAVAARRIRAGLLRLRDALGERQPDGAPDASSEPA